MSDVVRPVDRIYYELHLAGWSIGDAGFVGPGGSTAWVVYGTKGERQIRGEGQTQLDAWRDAERKPDVSRHAAILAAS